MSPEVKRIGKVATLMGVGAITASACTAEQVQDFEARTGIDVPSPIERTIVDFQMPKALDPVVITKAANVFLEKAKEINNSEENVTIVIDPQPRIDIDEIIQKMQRKYKKAEIKYNFKSLSIEIDNYFKENPHLKNKVMENTGIDLGEALELCSKELEKDKLRKRAGENCIPGLASLIYAHGITGDEKIKEFYDSYIENTNKKLPDEYSTYTFFLLSNWQLQEHPEIFIPILKP